MGCRDNNVASHFFREINASLIEKEVDLMNKIRKWYYKTKLKAIKCLRRNGFISIHNADKWSCKTIIKYSSMIKTLT